MSTREIAYNIISRMPDDVLDEFIGEYIGYAEEKYLSDELLEALAESEYMDKHPEEYKTYTDVDEMFKEMLAE